MGAELVKGFPPESPVGWSDNSSPDSGGGEESGGAMEGTMEGVTEGAIEGVTEGCSRQGRLWPWTEIISELELIFF